MDRQIVIIGRDPLLLQTRKWLLAKCGHVETATSPQALVELLRSGHIHLVVLCHTLTSADYDEITTMLRALSPSTQVLRLLTGWDQGDLLLPDHTCIPLDGPQTLLRKAIEILETASDQAAR